MQSIQIDGTFTFATNIKELKIGDQIKLISNPNNRLNSDAIGAYTMNGNKIGYVPFKTNQIDITNKYYVTKIKLSQQNPILLISRQFENSNFIISEPTFIKNIKYNCENNNITTELENKLKHFVKYLKNSSNDINKVKITFNDLNYVNLLIETFTEKTLFWTVTKKYYEENIFKYDEFYNFKLIPLCIYQEFQIHRLEDYLEKNYKSIKSFNSMNKIKKNKILNLYDKFNQYNFGFEQIKTNDLKSINKINITGQVYNQEQLNNLIKLIIQYEINPNDYYKPINYLKYINKNSNFNFKPNLDEFKQLFNNIKLVGICYHHKLKYYTNIDLYDDNSIIEIFNNKIINEELFIKLLLSLIISNKFIINLYNPMEGFIYKLEIPDIILNSIKKIIFK